MTSEKKNQHYIPKFYLRNFSFQNNRKQIGVYNVENGVFVQTGKLKTQGSQDFYYGRDGKLEDILSELEDHFANSINYIISSKELPKPESKDYQSLLLFVAITALRSPVYLIMLTEMSDAMKSDLNKLDPNFKGFHDFKKIGNHKLIAMLLSMSAEVAEIISDLEIKLILNNTATAFISSDFPMVKYNQFLEGKRNSSNTGFGVIGLQIIIPINDTLSVIFFDNSIYRVGNKRDKFLVINNQKDVDSLNILQFVNCYSTIFFNEKTTEAYLSKIHQKSKKFKRANQGKTELSYLIKEGEIASEILKKKENLLIINATECETGLTIQGLKIHSKGKSMKTIKSNELRLNPQKLRYAKRINANDV